MSFPFPEIKRSQFLWTFLKDVTLKVEFTVDEQAVDEVALKEMFQTIFGLDNVGLSDIREGHEVESSEGYLRIKASLSSLELRLRFPEYRGYEEMQKWYGFFLRYLTVLSIDILKRVVVIKYNELGYALPLTKVGVAGAMEQIFSGNLLDEAYRKARPSFPDWPRWERRMTLKDPVSQTMVDIIYGYSVDIDHATKGKLTMKTEASTMDAMVDITRLGSIADSLNILLDRAFQWSVTQQILKRMEGK